MAVASPILAPSPLPFNNPPRARAPYASISSIMVTGRVCFLVLWGHWNGPRTRYGSNIDTIGA